MPPVDSSAPTPAPDQTPAPEQTTAPAPEPPKKQGFFAKLFGGGKSAPAAPTVPADHESQTPPPQLDDATDRDLTVPAAEQPTPQSFSPANEAEQLPDLSATAPAPAADASAPTEPTTPTTDEPPAGPTFPAQPQPDDQPVVEDSEATPPAGPTQSL